MTAIQPDIGACSSRRSLAPLKQGVGVHDSLEATRPARQPAISVVMPVYNCQKYLAESIESILSQTFGDFELIIVDDGSTDQSLPIARRYAKWDERIRIISRPNTGIVGALNDGIEAARADIIARMDGDDISYPRRFEVQMNHMRAHPECVLLGTRVMLVDEECQPICEWAKETTHEEIERAHFEHRWPMVHPTCMMRRREVLEIGGYRQKYFTQEDVDIFLRLAERGRIANVPEILLSYRQHFHSICFQHSQLQREIRAALFDETYERRRMAPVMDMPSPNQLWKRALKHRWWAWKALDAGNVATARKHALQVMRRQPLHIESWRLMYCAMRGH